MSSKTGIEWTDSTWNPVTGCSKVSMGCKNCYAERFFPRAYGKERSFTDVRFHVDRLDKPLRWRSPRRVFVNSMSDLFHVSLSNKDIDKVFAIMALCPQHTFQVLTKRPERMSQWSHSSTADRIDAALVEMDIIRREHFQWPLPNVWLGVSVENQATADERVPRLLMTPAACRFVSYEPALGPVDLRFLRPRDPPVEIDALNGTHGIIRPHRGQNVKLDWVIIGGESGPGARPFDPSWARSVIKHCKAAGVACFVKQLGARPIGVWEPGAADTLRDRLHLSDHKGGDDMEWPRDLRVREFPIRDDRKWNDPTKTGGDS